MATSLPGAAFNRYVPKGEKSPPVDATLAHIDSNLPDASTPAEISRQAASNVNETLKSSNLVGSAFLPAVSTQETGIAETPQASSTVSTSQNAKSDTPAQQEGFLSRILSGIKRLVSPSNSTTNTTNGDTSNTANISTINSADVHTANTTTNTANAQHIDNNPIEVLSSSLSSIKQQLSAETVSAPRPSVGETQETTSQGTTAPVPVSASPTAKTPDNMQSAGLLARILSGVKNRFAPPVGLPSSAPTADEATGASKQESGPSPATVTSGFVNLMGWILNGVRAKFKAPVGAPPSVSSMTKDVSNTTTATNKATETTSRASEKETISSQTLRSVLSVLERNKASEKETISSQTLRSVLSVLEHDKENGPANDAAVKIFDEGLENLQSVATDILRAVKDGTSTLHGGETQGASAAATTETESKTATPYIPNQNDAANFAMSQAKGITATVPAKQQPTELYKPPVMLPDSDVTLVSGPTKDTNPTTLHAPTNDNRTTLHTGPTPDQNRTTLHVPQEPVMMELDPLANKMAEAISGLKDAVDGSIPASGKTINTIDQGTKDKESLTNPFGLGDFIRTLKDRVGPTSIGQGLGQVKEAAMNVPFTPGAESGQVGDIMGGLGKLASAIPIIGKPIEAMGKLGEVTFGAVGKLQDWTKSLHDANMQFAEFSGSMAAVQAAQEARDIQLSHERGERRAKSAEYLAEGKSNLSENLAPIKDLVGNVTNYIGGALSNLGAVIISPITAISKLLQGEFTKKGTDSEPVSAADWMQQLGEGMWEDYYGKPDKNKDEPGWKLPKGRF